MGLLDRLMPWRKPAPMTVVGESIFLPDLPLRRELATIEHTAAVSRMRTQEALVSPFGVGGLDGDDHLYRPLTGNAGQRRDLAPLAQEKMLEVANWLWDGNGLGKRLITLMADLILGEGIAVQAADARNQEVIDRTWNHRVNQLATNIRQFYCALAVNGELILPVASNPMNGLLTLGYLDPYQIKSVQTLPDNVLVHDTLTLKPNLGQSAGKTLKIIRENPETGRLEGDVFFFPINGLPNSTRGRSDLLPVADYLDLYDGFMFGEVERVALLSAFVWDYTITGAKTEKDIDDRLRKLPRPTPGQIFAHNENEALEAKTPDLKAMDRTEIGRSLRVHIAGSMGYPLTYLGDTDSNRATIEGQNDITLKTPAARQKEFAGFIDKIVRFSIERAQTLNPSLYRDVQQGYKIVMPEISAKDISRVGQVVSQVIAGLDTAMANKTMSRRAAVTVQAALIKHLGIELDPQEIMAEADEDEANAQDKMDTAMATAAARRTANPPVVDPADDQEDEPAFAD